MTADGAPESETSGAEGPVLFWIAAAMLAFAALVRGGNRPLPLLVLELAGVGAIVVFAWTRGRAGWIALPAALRWGIALLLVFPLLQLLPLPGAWWQALPGHGDYARALEAAGVEAGMRPVTLHPAATQYAWLALLPCLGMFLAAQGASRRQVRALALVFIAVAVAEAVLGILQVGAGRESALQLGNRFGGGMATGTYVNRNHFAALMAMALPVLVAFWAAETLPPRGPQGERLREHPRHADARLARRILWSLLVVLALAALLFSRSRAGIGCGLAAFGAASLALVWSAGTMPVRLLLGAVAAIALLLAAYVGLTPIIERFAPDELVLGYEGRARIAGAALRGALDFLPFGSGLGTFADAFARYQGMELRGFVDHAHNDYAEAFLELGVAAVAVVALLGAAVLQRWGALARRRPTRTLGALPACAGIGMLALAVHGLFDFNFHIPANAIYFSFLAGVFFYEPRA